MSQHSGFLKHLAFWIYANPIMKKSIPDLPPNSANEEQWSQFEAAVEQVAYSAAVSTPIVGWMDRFGNFEPQFAPWMQDEMDACEDQDLWKPLVRLER